LSKLTNIFSQDLKVIAYFWDGHKVAVSLMILMSVISGFMEMLNVAVLLPMIQSGATYLSGNEQLDNTGALNNLLVWIDGITGFNNHMLSSSLLVVVVSLCNFLYKLFYTYYVRLKIEKIYLGIKSEIFKILKSADYSFYTSTEHGKLLHKTSVAPDGILAGTHSFIRIINQIITIGFLLIMMAFASSEILLLLIAVGVIYFFVSKKIITWLVKEKSKECMHLKQDDMHLAGQFVSGVKPIRLYLATDKWERKYNAIAKRFTYLQRYIAMGFVLPGALIQLLLGIGVGGAGFYIVRMDLGVEAVAILGMFVVAANRLNGAITGTINDYSGWVHQYPLIKEVHSLLTSVNTEMLNDGISNSISFDNCIEVKNISFTYPNRLGETLRNVSLAIFKNKTIGIVGGSGGGKSTLLNIILRLFQPTHGQILIDGTSVDSYSLNQYWSLFGLVSQDTFLINGSIRDNILFGESYDDEKLIDAAIQADVDAFISSLPDGYETIVGENGVQLSGGQKQRISIARALLRNPPILVLDEPTSALDIDTEQKIMKTINALSGERTIIMIAHRFSTIKNADEIVVMDEGEIIDVGSHNKLMESNSRYRRMYMANILD